MADARPGPGEELNTGSVSTPRDAASVVLLRGGDERLELLLSGATRSSGFMGGAWVFPGGALDRADGSGEEALRATALRELAEEASVVVDDLDALVPYSRWITPEIVKVRFDTRFFLIAAPADADPRARRRRDGRGALARARGGARGPSARRAHAGVPDDQAPGAVRGVRDRRCAPRARPCARGDAGPAEGDRAGETARVVLPGEPGYDA